MCMFKVKVRGITICGRSVYATDTGVKVGWTGPTVSLQDAISDLSNEKADYLARSYEEIVRKMGEKLQAEKDAAEREANCYRELEQEGKDEQEAYEKRIAPSAIMTPNEN